MTVHQKLLMLYLSAVSSKGDSVGCWPIGSLDTRCEYQPQVEETLLRGSVGMAGDSFSVKFNGYGNESSYRRCATPWTGHQSNTRQNKQPCTLISAVNLKSVINPTCMTLGGGQDKQKAAPCP